MSAPGKGARTDNAAGHTTLPGTRCGRVVRPRLASASCACQIPAVMVPWFLNNVARNSLAIISNIEMESLELQRLWAMSKNDRVKLRATFGWGTQERGAYRRRGRACDTAGHAMRPRRAHARFLQSWSHGSSTMSHVIPSRLFQILKSSRWNCNVCGLCRKVTVLNYVRLLGECPRKGEAYRQRGRAYDTAGRTMWPRRASASCIRVVHTPDSCSRGPVVPQQCCT